MQSISSAVVRLARLELDARVEVFGVLADDHQIDRHAAEERAHPGIVLAGADAGEQAQLLAQVDVDAAEAGADGRGDGGLQGTAGAADAFQDGVRQRRAGPLHHVDPRLLHVPVDLHAGGVHAPPGGLGQFRAHPVAGNQGYFVGHRLASQSNMSETRHGNKWPEAGQRGRRASAHRRTRRMEVQIGRIRLIIGKGRELPGAVVHLIS